MSDLLQRLLAERPFLLADGATGTNLFAAGLETGEAPELWNEINPEGIVALHQSFVDAGADIILTNTFGGTVQRLKLHKADGRMAAINRRAAELARGVADRAGRPVVVAGSMGPTGELIEPLGALSMEACHAAYADQAKALAAGGADVLWIETLSSREELTAAVAGAGEAGLPIVTTLSFDTNGRTMMGVTPADAVKLFHALQPRPIAYGANCGIGAAELATTILGLSAAADSGDVIIAKGNCGIPQFVDGAIRYDGTPELMADYTRLVRDAGARIIGGCCGTSPAHLAAMRRALDAHVPGARPSVEEIVSRLGRVSAGALSQLNGPTVTAEEAGGRRRGRRGRGEGEGSTPAF